MQATSLHTESSFKEKKEKFGTIHLSNTLVNLKCTTLLRPGLAFVNTCAQC